MLTDSNRETLTELHAEANTGCRYKDYPPISHEAFNETPQNPGCIMGGNSLLYIDSAGNLLPCMFLPVSFGNIMEEEFSDLLRKMRCAIPQPLHIGCPAVTLNNKIRTLRENGAAIPVPCEEIKTWMP